MTDSSQIPPVDAVLVFSFGGPDGPADVMPFLRNVTAGRNVPDERLEVVARQYELFGGRSPINDHNRALIAALEQELDAYLKDRLAKYKCPRSIDFIEAMPRDPNGKLYKRRLRDPYWKDRERRI